MLTVAPGHATSTQSTLPPLKLLFRQATSIQFSSPLKLLFRHIKSTNQPVQVVGDGSQQLH